MKLAVGCDHGGFEVMESIRAHLKEKGIEYVDFGTHSTDSVDYPLIALKVAKDVSGGDADLGVLVCSTGIGISIAANKVVGIRAAVVTNELCAELTRKDNNANILCMGGKVVDGGTAVKILDKFINTDFEGGRHARRVGQIADIEAGRL